MTTAVYDRWVLGVLVLAGGLLIGRTVRPAELAARWMIGNAQAQVFRIHWSDIRDFNLANEPKRIRCPQCGGTPQPRGIDKWTGQVVGCPSCGMYGSVDVRGLLKPVVIVPDTEPTSYVR